MGIELKLKPPTGYTNGNYGSSVAISGDKLVVGAIDYVTGEIRAGSVYVYDLSAADVQGSLLRLIGSDSVRDRYYGRSVGISGDQLAVGALGLNIHKVYLYDLSEADVQATENII